MVDGCGALIEGKVNIMDIKDKMIEIDYDFEQYCQKKGIKDPFKEDWEHRHKMTNIATWEYPEDDEQWQMEWYKRKEEYLRMRHEFVLWELHFWLDWEEFMKYAKFSKEYVDIKKYLPCDCAGRQCNMWCIYFGEKCIREEEELKIPEILELEK